MAPQPEPTPVSVPFFDLRRQLAEIRPDVDRALADVLEDGAYTNGPAVAAFEERFAAFCGVPHCVAVNNGTSALQLALDAFGAGPGDEVVTVSMSFIATAWPILYAGATPVLVDVSPDRMTMDPAALERAITPRTRAIIVVHLYGQCADMDPILAAAAARGIPVIEDCAQAHGAEYKGRRAGSMGAVGCFSFYPSKNLGAYGEGGAVTTHDAALAERCRRVRNQGQQERYLHTEIGHNFRMNSFEGAILSVKLAHLERWTERRNALARAYDAALAGLPLTTPAPCPDGRHAYHLYVVRHERREALRAALRADGVETAVHYPRPIHLQPVFERYGYRPGSLPVTEAVARTCISLPLYPEMPDAHVERVAAALRAALADGGPR
uniref:DegT/DnrJ/EryC1/StrS family aminotransferase n=1 Tax=Eiseniibacteriota bacterium TaxID=2212470 RepID=A0A832I4R4_UNCEI